MLDIRPRPSDRSSSSVTATSFDAEELGVASSPVQPDRDRARMRVEPFRLAERDGGGAKRGKLIGPAFQDRGALDEIEHA